jgi:IS30 family transposase
MARKIKTNNKHLTLVERQIIQTGIENGSNKVDIARTLAKDPTTIAKEISKHRTFKPRNFFNNPCICIHLKSCGSCSHKCDRYEEKRCSRRDKSPGACNKCKDGSRCRLDKFIYDAEAAHAAYKSELSLSRTGYNLTEEERTTIGETIAPLLEKGQSVYQIKSEHDELVPSARSLYTYIESGLFKDFSVSHFSLKEKVNRRPREKNLKKRKHPAHYDGRRYSDFLRFMNENPDIQVVEMDTVMNNLNGPYIQTFLFRGIGLMIGFLKADKTNATMAATLDDLQERLGDMFSNLFPVILTDRGSEFEIFDLFERGKDGKARTRMFYCDPQQSSQKPHVECNHNYVRDILPNGMSLDRMTQQGVELMFSHINSTPRFSLKGKTPYEMFAFLYGEKFLELLKVENILRDDVVLKPFLITRLPDSRN